MFLLIGGLACLPNLLIWALVVVLFLIILWLILGKAPAPIGGYAQWIVLVVGLIILLFILIQLAQGGIRSLC